MAEPFDDTARTFYRDLFQTWGMRVKSEYPVYRRSRRIDLIVECSDQDQVKLQDTVFSFFRYFNGLEFKGPRDPLTLRDYNRIMMRAWGLGTMAQRPKAGQPSETVEFALSGANLLELPANRSVTIVCVVRPSRILDELGVSLGFHRTADPGVYRNRESLPCWIIVPSELPLTARNYPLLPLAQGAKLRDFIALCVRERYNEYLRMALDVGLVSDPETIWNRILEGVNMRSVWTKEALAIVDKAFREKPELPYEFPTLRQVLEAAEERARNAEEAAEERARNAEEAAEEWARNTVECAQAAAESAQAAAESAQAAAESAQAAAESAEQRGETKARRESILRLVQHKFGSIPDSVAAAVETVSDLATLDQWLDRIIDAHNLTDLV